MCAFVFFLLFFQFGFFKAASRREFFSVCVFDSLLLLDDETFVLSERVIARERERKRRV